MLPLRRLALNGGIVTGPPIWRLTLPPIQAGYSDAQIDDYGLPTIRRRRDYVWWPGIQLSLQARFSHPQDTLIGTAGFGFWNAPFGDPTVPLPALPQATWFFFASSPTDLPLAPTGPGRGWFASTLDATTRQAVMLAPLAPLVLLLNQVPSIRRRLWPGLQQRLGMSFAPIPVALTNWHTYQLQWAATHCTFWVDEQIILKTAHSPKGPLGFVCWLDNQYLVVTANGRFRWGTLPILTTQWLEVTDLTIRQLTL